MPASMQHWNGNMVCAMDVETTGVRPGFHEIVQLAMVPLDSNFEQRKDIMPLNILIRPDCPERADKQALAKCKLKLPHLLKTGFDQEASKDLLENWIDKLGLPLNQGGVNRCKIIPLGHNISFDISFVKDWLGEDLYNEWFHYHPRDPMLVGAYLNDRAAMHGEKVPFSKISLSYMCSTLKIPNYRAHDALQDCLAVAKLYKKVSGMGLF